MFTIFKKVCNDSSALALVVKRFCCAASVDKFKKHVSKMKIIRLKFSKVLRSIRNQKAMVLRDLMLF